MISLYEIEWLKQASKNLPEHKETIKRAQPITNEELINQLLQEGPSRKDFRMAADLIKKGPEKDRQRLADHYATTFAKQNPRFDHKKWHEWIGTNPNVAHKAKHDTYMDDETSHKEAQIDELSKKLLGRYVNKVDTQAKKYGTGIGSSGHSEFNRSKRGKGREQAIRKYYGLGIKGGYTKVKATEEAQIDEALEGGAAHKRMVQKMMAAGDIHSAISHTVTRYDREQQARAAKNPARSHYNPHALGLYLGAAQQAADDIKGGKNHAEAINTHFNGALANRLHKHLQTGGVDVDTMRRKKFNEGIQINERKKGWNVVDEPYSLEKNEVGKSLGVAHFKRFSRKRAALSNLHQKIKTGKTGQGYNYITSPKGEKLAYNAAKAHRMKQEETQIDETLPANAKAKDYIDDFVHSKNKMFSKDSKKQRIKRALGAWYGKHHKEETEIKEGKKDDAFTKMHKQTLRMPDAMLGVMGGPTKKQSAEYLKKQRLSKKWMKDNPDRGWLTGNRNEETELEEGKMGYVSRKNDRGEYEHGTFNNTVIRGSRRHIIKKAKEYAKGRHHKIEFAHSDRPYAPGEVIKKEELDEKWGSNYETPKSKRGMFKGRSLSSLEAQAKGAHGTKAKQVNFAIRAKKAHGGKWKGVTAEENLDELYGKGSVEKIGNWHARMQDIEYKKSKNGSPLSPESRAHANKYAYHSDQTNRADHLGMAISARKDRKFAAASEKKHLIWAKVARDRAKAMKEENLIEKIRRSK